MIKLRRRASVQANRRATFVFRDTAGTQEGQMVGIDPHSKLDCHRNAFGVAHGGLYDSAQEVRLDGNRCASSFARHLRDRTTEVHVQMIDASFANQALHASAM
jgi:hypothetical protein